MFSFISLTLVFILMSILCPLIFLFLSKQLLILLLLLNLDAFIVNRFRQLAASFYPTVQSCLSIAILNYMLLGDTLSSFYFFFVRGVVLSRGGAGLLRNVRRYPETFLVVMSGAQCCWHAEGGGLRCRHQSYVAPCQ